MVLVRLGVPLAYTARRGLRSSGRTHGSRRVGAPKAVPNKTVAAAPELPGPCCGPDVDTLRDLTHVSKLEGTLHDIPHLSKCELREEVEERPHPRLQGYAHDLDVEYTQKAFHVEHFVDEDDVVPQTAIMSLKRPKHTSLFRRAGMRSKVYFASDDVEAAIVTCGGLCPGINTVIREIVHTLWDGYGVRAVYGVRCGYRGFYSENLEPLTPELVEHIHMQGGSFLGTSRGGFDVGKIADAIQYRGLNQVYIIGGDGAHRGAQTLFDEVVGRRRLKVAIVCIPKTIDNDIGIIDCSFGFNTAVEETRRAIEAAQMEAQSHRNAIGLVKVMGRQAGFIALISTLASCNVDACLIPEVPFYLDGDPGLLQYLRHRLARNGHAVVVLAEGAGQHLLLGDAERREYCPEGDCGVDWEPKLPTAGALITGERPALADVGTWLKRTLKQRFAQADRATGEEPIQLSVKYIDPTYMIRATRPNASDNVYCTVLAQAAVHGGFAGFTGFTVGPINNVHAYIPIRRAVQHLHQVKPGAGNMWSRLLAATGQPDFVPLDPSHHNSSHG